MIGGYFLPTIASTMFGTKIAKDTAFQRANKDHNVIHTQTQFK